MSSSPRDYGKPVVVAGFEPLDILQSIYMLMQQLSEGRAEIENQYARVVPWDGNPVALKAIGADHGAAPVLRVARAWASSRTRR